MSLPVLIVPEYKVKLYSLPKAITVRPYLVGEEKILLMAQQGDDPKEVQSAVEQILTRCTLGKVDIKKLPSFDLEYLYLQLRAKSVNNIVVVSYRCRNTVTKKVEGKDVEDECGETVPVEIDLDSIQIKMTEGHTNKIWLNDEVGVVLSWPTKEVLDKVRAQGGVFGIDLLQQCLVTIFTKTGETHEVQDVDPVEVEKFIGSLNVAQFAKIQNFFDTMPKLVQEVQFKCPKCKYEQKILLSGLMDFFV